jgi:reactive intermediate/imine deaminase
VSPRNWTSVDSPDENSPVGAYSRCVRAGGLLFISGQVPRDFATGALLGQDLASQTRGVIANLRRVLEGAGARLSDVVSVTAYLEDMGDWAAFNEAYREAFEAPYPTRTTVGARLHGVLVEISAVAAVPE